MTVLWQSNLSGADNVDVVAGTNNAFSSVHVDPGASLKYDTALKITGSPSLIHTQTNTGGDEAVGFYAPGADITTAVAVRMYFRFSAWPTDDVYLIELQDSNPSHPERVISSIRLNADGDLVARDALTAPDIYIYSTGLPLDTWFSIEMMYATSTGNNCVARLRDLNGSLISEVIFPTTLRTNVRRVAFGGILGPTPANFVLSTAEHAVGDVWIGPATIPPIEALGISSGDANSGPGSNTIPDGGNGSMAVAEDPHSYTVAVTASACDGSSIFNGASDIANNYLNTIAHRTVPAMGMMLFDLTGIPQSATITSAKLHMYAYPPGASMDAQEQYVFVENNIAPPVFAVSGVNRPVIRAGDSINTGAKRTTIPSTSTTMLPTDSSPLWTAPNGDSVPIATLPAGPVASINFASLIQPLLANPSWSGTNQTVSIGIVGAKTTATGSWPKITASGINRAGRFASYDNTVYTEPRLHIAYTYTPTVYSLQAQTTGSVSSGPVTMVSAVGYRYELFAQDGAGSQSSGISNLSVDESVHGSKVVQFRMKDFDLISISGILMPELCGSDDIAPRVIDNVNGYTVDVAMWSGDPPAPSIRVYRGSNNPVDSWFSPTGYYVKVRDNSAFGSKKCGVRFDFDTWPSRYSLINGNLPLSKYSSRHYFRAVDQVVDSHARPLQVYLGTTLQWYLEINAGEFATQYQSGKIRLCNGNGSVVVPWTTTRLLGNGFYRYEIQVQNTSPKVTVRIYFKNDVGNPVIAFSGDPTNTDSDAIFFGDKTPYAYYGTSIFADLEVHANYDLSEEYPSTSSTTFTGAPYERPKNKWYEYDGTVATEVTDIGTITAINGDGSVTIDSTDVSDYADDWSKLTGVDYSNYHTYRYIKGKENDATDKREVIVRTPAGTAPPGGWPTLLFVHGGAFIGGDMNDVSPQLYQHFIHAGYAVASINYTLSHPILSTYPPFNPTWPYGYVIETILGIPIVPFGANGAGRHPSHIVEIKECIKFLQDPARCNLSNLSTTDTFLYGYSAGGGLALYAGMSLGLDDDGSVTTGIAGHAPVVPSITVGVPDIATVGSGLDLRASAHPEFGGDPLTADPRIKGLLALSAAAQPQWGSDNDWLDYSADRQWPPGDPTMTKDTANGYTFYPFDGTTGLNAGVVHAAFNAFAGLATGNDTLIDFSPVSDVIAANVTRIGGYVDDGDVPPLWLAHGPSEFFVKYGHSQQVYDAAVANGVPATLRNVSGHHAMTPEYLPYEEMVAFCDEILGR